MAYADTVCLLVCIPPLLLAFHISIDLKFFYFSLLRSFSLSLSFLRCKGMAGSSSNSLLFDAYMVRGEALSGLGSTEQVREGY
jgi:hypothetical protein